MPSHPNHMINAPTPIIDIEVVASQWQGVIDSARQEIEQAVTTVINHVAQFKTEFEISLVFVDNAGIQDLNKNYREKDKPTNVLSFPMIEKFSEIETMPTPVILGDIILAWETVSTEAETQEKSLHHHMIHLIVHGVMHLLGFDHENDVEADEMEKIEIEILNQLHIPNPYL